MSIVCTELNRKTRSTAKEVKTMDEKREKSAKERLLFCRCTC